MMVQHVRRCREFTGPTPHSVAIVSVGYFCHSMRLISTFSEGCVRDVSVLFDF